MKRLILLSSLAILFTPYIASAEYGRDGGGRYHHRKIGADQMANAGFAAAAMIGIAGYLVLRRRSAS